MKWTSKYLDVYFCIFLLSHPQQYQRETLTQNMQEFLSRYLADTRTWSKSLLEACRMPRGLLRKPCFPYAWQDRQRRVAGLCAGGPGATMPSRLVGRRGRRAVPAYGNPHTEARVCPTAAMTGSR